MAILSRVEKPSIGSKLNSLHLAVLGVRQATELRAATLAQVLVGTQQEAEDGVVEREDHDRADDDRERGPDDADA